MEMQGESFWSSGQNLSHWISLAPVNIHLQQFHVSGKRGKKTSGMRWLHLVHYALLEAKNRLWCLLSAFLMSFLGDKNGIEFEKKPEGRIYTIQGNSCMEKKPVVRLEGAGRLLSGFPSRAGCNGDSFGSQFKPSSGHVPCGIKQQSQSIPNHPPFH